MEEVQKIALLIDADNFPSQHAPALMAKAAAYGNIIVRRAYGTGAKSFGWKAEPLLRYAIEPVMRFHHRAGKNVADFALVIDAMELALRKAVDAFCIASNDSDFSLLAIKLREHAMKVYGFGDERALESFVASCDEFTRFASPHVTAAETPAEMDIAQIKQSILELCDSAGESGMVNLGHAGNYLRRLDPAFTHKRYGYSSLKALVESIPELETHYNQAALYVKKSGGDHSQNPGGRHE